MSDFKIIRGGRLLDAGARAAPLRDILIRDVGIPGALRVTAGTAQETEFFLASLAELGPGGAR